MGQTLASDQAERAARLFGASAGLRESTDFHRLPDEEKEHERQVAAARSALGDEAFKAAWSAGRVLIRNPTG